MKNNDDLLIYYIHLNNKEALNILNEKYSNVIKVLINKYVVFNQLNREEYYDLLEDCMLAYNRAIYGYRFENGTFYMYIKMIISNYIFGTLKRNYQRKNRNIYECDLKDNNPLFDLLKDSSNIETSYSCSEERKYLINNIKIPHAKEVIEMKSLGYSYEEIASQLGITKKKVDNILCEVKRKYHNLL